MAERTIDIIRQKYPRLLPERFGFECGEGWRQIIEDFFATVDRLLPADAKFNLRQLKEKLGGMRIYYRLEGVPGEIEGKISDAYNRASARSYRVCEICGKRGRFSKRGGLLTVVCEDHLVDDFGKTAVPVQPEADYLIRTKEGWFRYDYDLDAFLPTDPPEEH
ncbi:hypothetical protein E0J20_09060 [Rhizobium leguminosarum bv. viciae]|nr:hypothetical protein E0J20_09060 [Rhizobium leguminosarum bv. viciae]